VRDFSPLQLILFGSHARRDAGPASDIDLLVVLPHVANKRLAAIAIRRALADLPVCKDIVVTTPEEITRRGDLVDRRLDISTPFLWCGVLSRSLYAY
jgi:predicted nucleotidyltransferase